jgi:hypothetical protein
VEREGMSGDEVRRIEEQYRAQAGKKSIPDKQFRIKRQRPLLLLHLTAPELDGNPLDTYGKPLVALGLSFPVFDDSKVAKRVLYKINLVDFRNLFELEAEDEPEVEDDSL